MTQNLLCNLPANPTDDDWDVSLIDGQLLANGGSYDLIQAVASGDRQLATEEINKIDNPDQHDLLSRIVDRLLLIVTQH